jgi:hypothetical protein
MTIPSAAAIRPGTDKHPYEVVYSFWNEYAFTKYAERQVRVRQRLMS